VRDWGTLADLDMSEVMTCSVVQEIRTSLILPWVTFQVKQVR